MGIGSTECGAEMEKPKVGKREREVDSLGDLPCYGLSLGQFPGQVTELACGEQSADVSPNVSSALSLLPLA